MSRVRAHFVTTRKFLFDDFTPERIPVEHVWIRWSQQADFEGPVFRGDVRQAQPGNLRLAELLVAVPVSRPEEGHRRS